MCVAANCQKHIALQKLNERSASASAPATSMSIGSLKQERYRQRRSNYDECLKNREPGSTAPERPEPLKF
jgi:hypothetical protein